MLDDDTANLPYVLWYQCRLCTHLFYNDQNKIIKHLRDKHGYGGASGVDTTPTTATKGPPTSAPTALSKGTTLKIKEQHFVAAIPSTSSITDGDGDLCAEDVINNNNNNSKYATNSNSLTKRMPKLFHKDDITKEGSHHVAISQIQQNPRHRINANNVRRVVPSIEELKRQLVNSDIDISEIKMTYEEDDEEGEDEEEDGQGGIMEYNEGDEEIKGQAYKQEGYEDQDAEDGSEEVDEEEEEEEEEEESASTSNQSFYDTDMGEQFLFGQDPDSESNYDEDGIMTPNFGMVDELYRRASMAASTSTSSSSDPSASNRRRTFHNPCKLCNKIFPSLSMLKKHAKTHNTHICKFCFDCFPSAAGLSKHLRVHSEENPNVCQECNKSFTSWATLRTHMKIHSGERPFGCDQCGQRFQTKSTLDSHLRIHSGSRPHVCPVCFKSFRTSSPLYRHMRSVHKGLPMTMGTVTVNS
ncbi:zinc finger protein 583 [Folsomia candida]|nr:zinc finger protein 583 [Folsomia candida]